MATKLRIAQVSPLPESVPGRIVSYLTEELRALGHQVTLFAPGEVQDRADTLAAHFVLLEQVYRRAGEFDLVHFHTDYLAFPVLHRVELTHLTTLHGRLDVPELQQLYAEFSDIPLVSISDAQRAPLPCARWVRTIHHGIPAELHEPGDGGDYLAFVGDDGLERATEIAERAGMPLAVEATATGELLRGARALLSVGDSSEPFELAMVEAMACGTPVVAWRAGSAAEVVEDGETGYVVASIEEAVTAVAHAGELSRELVRARFEDRFTSRRMACEYADLYHYSVVPEVTQSRPHLGDELARRRAHARRAARR